MSKCSDKFGDVVCQLDEGHGGRHYAETANEEDHVEACSWDLEAPECYTGVALYISDWAPRLRRQCE